MEERPAVLFIVGPTASGKTGLAIRCAQKVNAEVVSADSVQVYRLLDIGSAKPTEAEREGIPHHLLDCVDICDRSFSVSAYRQMAQTAIAEIVSRGRLPIVVGGSGLYINALIDPLNFAIPANAEIRQELSEAYDASPEQIWSRLQEADPDTAARLHINDKKRIVRALEVYFVGGKPLSEYGANFTKQDDSALPYRPILIGLTMERAELYARINRRVDEMMRCGLLDEVRMLQERGFARDLPALQSIGYRQLLAHLDGSGELEDAVEAIKRETRRFAKRQMTWFKRDNRIKWFDAADPEILHAVIACIQEQMRDNERTQSYGN